MATNTTMNITKISTSQFVYAGFVSCVFFLVICCSRLFYYQYYCFSQYRKLNKTCNYLSCSFIPNVNCVLDARYAAMRYRCSCANYMHAYCYAGIRNYMSKVSKYQRTEWEHTHERRIGVLT